MGMLATVRKIMGFQMTIAEWFGTAVMLLVPYLTIGVVWTLFHTEHFRDTEGVQRIVWILGSVASWPALLISGTYFA
ncbi:MAG: hypothetical protein QOH57_3382 [Mycobacterium sp.]|jgi:hypothetical protein|nr:hypothetical protein [Mycobacterium sp.]